MKRISLFYRGGTSDKVYNAAVEPSVDGTGYNVTFSYGKRGTLLTSGIKNDLPISIESAEALFDELVQSKKHHPKTPYTECPDGSTHVSAPERRESGVRSQLLNPIDEDEALRLLEDDDWCMQPKKDGRNLIVRKNGDVEGINKLGLVVGLPETVIQDARLIEPHFLMPGEGIGDDLHAHDLLELGTEDLRSKPYFTRYGILEDEIVSASPRHIKLVPCAWTTKEKKAMWKKAKRDKWEGVVFKLCSAPFTSGRPNSGGDQLKCKFYATLSAIVASVNAQRSVNLMLLKAGKLTPIGKCTISPNFSVPRAGSIGEFRYLYMYPESNCLYQTIYLGPRDDVDATECSFEQQKPKYKQEES